MTSPKRWNLISLVFTCLCISKALLINIKLTYSISDSTLREYINKISEDSKSSGNPKQFWSFFFVCAQRIKHAYGTESG